MAKAKKPLQERVPIRRTAWKVADLVVLSLLLTLLAHRATYLLGGAAGSTTTPRWRCWLAALVCEAWFTLLWLLNMNCKWNPVRFETYPDRLPERLLPSLFVHVSETPKCPVLFSLFSHTF